MERKLTTLFDYQKFEGNEDLGLLIDSVHARYGMRELSMEDMELVNAAGVTDLPENKRKKEQEK